MSRARALQVGRVCFVLLTLVLAWWGFRGRWDEIGVALSETGPLRVALAVAAALAGLALTGVLWRMLLAALGSPVAPRPAAAVFFVGQLGKYVPGSVWSFAAQAQLGRRHGVPARSSVTASALFLMIHTFSGLLLGGVLAATGVVSSDIARGWWLLLALAGGVALAPPLLRRLGDRLAGNGVRTRFTAGELVGSLALMGGVWLCYGASAWVLVPGGGTGARGVDLLWAVGAFALAHVAGVLLVLAPAGLGAREAVLVALLAPGLGVPGAAAVALLARVAHSLADFAIAAAAAWWARERVPEATRAVDA